jgi:hypothetical protein
VKAQHLFILNYSPSEPEAAKAATDLRIKVAAKAESTTTLVVAGGRLAADATVPVGRTAGLSGFSHKVGFYVVSEANNALKLRSKQLANDICDYLDSRKDDLGITAKDLGKVVMVTCNAADRLKRDARGNVYAPALRKMKTDHPKEADLLNAYTAKGWDAATQAKLNETAAEYKQKPDSFSNGGQHLAQFACALDQRGVHPKIAAWDSGLFVNSDGTKSVLAVDGPRNGLHERLINKVMIKFERNDQGGSIRHLSVQEWSDKDLGLGA